MPIYTYRCESCGETFDKRQSFSDAALTTHETCGGDLRKVLHPAGIVFKGSGFYNTDYKNGSAAKTDGGTPSEPAAASTNGTSESKSEAKGESTGSASTSTSTDSGSAGSATTAKSEPAKSGSTS